MNLTAFIQVSSIVISMFYLLYLVYDLVRKEIREGREERDKQYERSRKAIKEANERLSTGGVIGVIEDPEEMTERYSYKKDPNDRRKLVIKIDDDENTIDPFDSTQTAIRVDKNKGKLLRVIYEFAKE